MSDNLEGRATPDPRPTDDYPLTGNMSRDAYRTWLKVQLNEQYGKLPDEDQKQFDELQDYQPGWLAKSRKALSGAVVGFASSFGPLILAATADGSISWEAEVVPALVIGGGAAVAGFLAVYYTRNAK